MFNCYGATTQITYCPFAFLKFFNLKMPAIAGKTFWKEKCG